MKISLFNFYPTQQNKLNPKQNYIPSFSQLEKDTVTFSNNHVLKKTDFDGFDLALIEKLKPNIQKFKNTIDLQNWAEEECKKIIESNFSGRQEQTKTHRQEIINEWLNYFETNPKDFSKTQKLIVLSSITKKLKPNNDTLPPKLNAYVLKKTFNKLEKRLAKNPKDNFDFNRIYENYLRKIYNSTKDTNNNAGNWVIIKSKINDKKNFYGNIEKLMALSHPNWCTKSFNAGEYLEKGDFHIYLENNVPKLCLRFEKNEISEIQNEQNDWNVKAKDLELLEPYLKENKFKINWDTTQRLKIARNTKQRIEKIKSDLGESTKLSSINDAEKVLKYLDIEIKQKTPNNKLILKNYKQPKQSITFADLGINEDDLFKYIKGIEEDAIFSESSATNLGNLEYIGRNACFEFSQITDLGKLKSIGGNAYFAYSILKNLKNLKQIDKNAEFNKSQIINLGNLQTIGGNAFFEKSNITKLGKLKTIGNDAIITNSKLDKNNFENINIAGKIID